MNVLRQRLSLYYKHHITARMTVVPAPSTVEEVNHLHNQFKRIGNLEYFHMQKNESKASLYGSEMQLVFNPSYVSLEDFLLSELDTERDDEKTLQTQQRRIMNRMEHVVALPRYSYIHNDADYLNRKVEIPFKHKLVGDALKYENLYSLNSSTMDRPFIQLLNHEIENLEDFKSAVRFNFAKFHKFSRLRLDTGVEGINSVKWGKHLDVTPNFMTHEKLFDLNTTVPSN